jgi:hypothetical protein
MKKEKGNEKIKVMPIQLFACSLAVQLQSVALLSFYP